jgi:hypothetical protein
MASDYVQLARRLVSDLKDEHTLRRIYEEEPP